MVTQLKTYWDQLTELKFLNSAIIPGQGMFVSVATQKATLRMHCMTHPVTPVRWGRLETQKIPGTTPTIVIQIGLDKEVPEDFWVDHPRRSTQYHFDMKLKPEVVPQWNGDKDSLAWWLIQVEQIAEQSEDLAMELGRIVPQRLSGLAKTWYFSIPGRERAHFEKSWDTMKAAIVGYYMNNQWYEKQKIWASQFQYQEPDHSRETPSEYIIRKIELISLVHSYSDWETIGVIMQESPTAWSQVLNTELYKTIVQFQNAVKFHKDNLILLGNSYSPQHQFEDWSSS